MRYTTHKIEIYLTDEDMEVIRAYQERCRNRYGFGEDLDECLRYFCISGLAIEQERQVRDAEHEVWRASLKGAKA